MQWRSRTVRAILGWIGLVPVGLALAPAIRENAPVHDVTMGLWQVALLSSIGAVWFLLTPLPAYGWSYVRALVPPAAAVWLYHVIQVQSTFLGWPRGWLMAIPLLVLSALWLACLPNAFWERGVVATRRRADADPAPS